MNSEQCLLMLVAIPSIEEPIVDWLLERREVSGFSTLRVDGHGADSHSLSLAEQVAGRQRKVMFQVHGSCGDLGALVEALKEDFQGAGLHYWIMPLMDVGHIL